MGLYSKICYHLETKLEPIMLLLARIFVFNVFFKSGKLKFDSYINDDWSSTVYLFKDIHPVPFIPAEIAAVLGTAGELILSILLVVGLLGRFSAAGLLVMTAVIEISFRHVDSEYVTATDHIVWALLLGIILARGPGALSVDHLFRKVKPL